MKICRFLCCAVKIFPNLEKFVTVDMDVAETLLEELFSWHFLVGYSRNHLCILPFAESTEIHAGVYRTLLDLEQEDLHYLGLGCDIEPWHRYCQFSIHYKSWKLFHQCWKSRFSSSMLIVVPFESRWDTKCSWGKITPESCLLSKAIRRSTQLNALRPEVFVTLKITYKSCFNKYCTAWLFTLI